MYGAMLTASMMSPRALRKLKQTGTALAPVKADRPAGRIATRKLAVVMRKKLAAVRAQTIAAVVPVLERMLKAEDDPIGAAMRAYESGVSWEDLPSKVRAILEKIYGDTAEESLSGIVKAAGISIVDAMFDMLNKGAIAFAHDRAAEIVGMRYDEDGDLIENPNAEWAISDTTRDEVKTLVTDTVEGKISVTDLPDALADLGAFSQARADMIARTEVRRANGEASLAGMRASGVVEQKVWLTSGDDGVSDECEENEAAGPIAVDDAFPSGDEAEPAHPNCRCAIAPWVTFDTEDEETQ